MKIDDVVEGLEDGVRLINFLELLIGKKVPTRYMDKPPNRIQKIQNLHIGLKFLEDNSDIRLVGVGAEGNQERMHDQLIISEFVDKNRKMILGFLWTCYKKYRIQTIKVQGKN
jgi:cortexillin 1/2